MHKMVLIEFYIRINRELGWLFSKITEQLRLVRLRKRSLNHRSTK